MNKLTGNVRYRIGYQAAWIIAAIAIYGLVIFLTFAALIHLSLINRSEGSLVYRMSFLVILLFAFSMRFREDFDFLLTLSTTRKDIFAAMLAAALILSAAVGALILAEQAVVDLLNRRLGFAVFIDPFHFISPYRTGNYLSRYAFFLSLCACASTLGLTLGSVFYRFGTTFMTVFWVALSAISVAFVSTLVWVSALKGELAASLRGLASFLSNFDLAYASGCLLAFAAAFGLAAFLVIRRLPQR